MGARRVNDLGSATFALAKGPNPCECSVPAHILKVAQVSGVDRLELRATRRDRAVGPDW